ncbi:hypothetical protein niasHT_032867 [Heterodera trifolii]|uniref:Uncharacterized protein n=1 Tax=Heterodera trifolii TaxID=157864 RepID=A0ABD2J317_9BILA
MANPELALKLELARTPGMSLDHFISLVAREESTQKAARRFTASNSRNSDRVDSYNDRGLTFHRNRNFPLRPANKYQRPYSNIKCYNCVHRSNNYIREKCHESQVAEFFENLRTSCTKKEETPNREKADEPKKGSKRKKSPKQQKCGGNVFQSAGQEKRQIEEANPKFGQRKRILKPTAKKGQQNQGEVCLQLGTIAQRGRGKV